MCSDNSFKPVDPMWIIEHTGGPSILVGWMTNGVYMPTPVVATETGIAELRTIIGSDPWTIRHMSEEDY
jgi:hypothetical protein